MDYKQLYENNEAFRSYVDRYCKKYDVTVAIALEHRIVRNYAEFLVEEGENKR